MVFPALFDADTTPTMTYQFLCMCAICLPRNAGAACTCRVFGGSSSFSIIESMQQVVVDIRIYLLYLLLMMWGFACAYCVLFRNQQEHEVRANSACARLCTHVTAFHCSCNNTHTHDSQLPPPLRLRC